jgi:hypothetical protein
MKYNYIPEDQLDTGKSKGEPVLLAPGDGNFMIMDIYETNKDGSQRISKSGKQYITLKLWATDIQGTEGIVYYDIYENMQWAILGLGKAIGRKLYNESGITDWQSISGCCGACVYEINDFNGRKSTRVKKFLSLPEGQQGVQKNIVQPPARIGQDKHNPVNLTDDLLPF